MNFRNYDFLMIYQILSLVSSRGECFAPPPSSRGSVPSQEAVGMIFDDLEWSLIILGNHHFLMILPDFVTCITWRRVLRTPSLFERECLKYICGREDCRQYQGETMCKFVMVFYQYLRIGQFVWARVLSGTRYYQSASMDCSGVIRKIHRREGEVSHKDFPS